MILISISALENNLDISTLHQDTLYTSYLANAAALSQANVPASTLENVVSTSSDGDTYQTSLAPSSSGTYNNHAQLSSVTRAASVTKTSFAAHGPQTVTKVISDHLFQQIDKNKNSLLEPAEKART